jgi:hypothetical protein
MESSPLNPSQARLKLAILNKQAEAKNSWEFYSEMRTLGLPDEVIEILQKVLKVTSKVAGTVISIGKIIVIKLIEYVAKHPLQVAGLAVGLGATYALGVALSGLFALVPTLPHWMGVGPLLTKLAIIIPNLCKTVFVPAMILSPVVGCVAGEIFDNKYPEVSESLQKIAQDFFDFFAQMMNSLRDEIDFTDFKESFT